MTLWRSLLRLPLRSFRAAQVVGTVSTQRISICTRQFTRYSTAAPETAHTCAARNTAASEGTVYMRPLPADLLALSAPEGRAALTRALSAGTAEPYVALSSAFASQSDVRLCGTATLAVVLNALGMDPGRRWRGVWRWHADDAIGCECAGLSPARIATAGTTLADFGALAACHGLRAHTTYAEAPGARVEFRDAVGAAMRGSGDLIAVSFSRGALGQTDDGHFSPIAAYDCASDAVLVLDVARFKYAPYWVPLERLFDAMSRVDRETQRSRGFVVLSRRD